VKAGEFLFQDLERVTTKRGSHVDPPLDEDWSDLVKLKWNAAVVRVDCGVEVTVRVAESQYRRGSGKWLPAKPDRYQALAPGGSCDMGDFRESWAYLNGVRIGAEIALGIR
jgi:hypothetical protein